MKLLPEALATLIDAVSSERDATIAQASKTLGKQPKPPPRPPQPSSAGLTQPPSNVPGKQPRSTVDSAARTGSSSRTEYTPYRKPQTSEELAESTGHSRQRRTQT